MSAGGPDYLKIEPVAHSICVAVYGPWDTCAEWQHEVARQKAEEVIDEMPQGDGLIGAREAFFNRLAASLGTGSGYLTIIVVGFYLLRWLAS